MDDSNISKLIEEVQNKPSLWNTALQDYSNKVKKGKDWEKIAALFNVTKKTAQNKWKSLTRKFRDEYSKAQRSRSGDGQDDVYESTWQYYSSLLFLVNCCTPNESSGNIEFINKKPLLPVSPSKKSMSPTMDDKNLAEQLLQMENRKQVLLKRSLQGNQGSDTAEYDKCNLYFLETLIPTMRKIHPEEILNCRNELSAVVQRFAYKNTESTSPLTDNNGKSNRRSTRQTASLSVMTTPWKENRKCPVYEDDNDVQIIDDKPSSSKRHRQVPCIKEEKKYVIPQPRTFEQYSRHAEFSMPPVDYSGNYNHNYPTANQQISPFQFDVFNQYNDWRTEGGTNCQRRSRRQCAATVTSSEVPPSQFYTAENSVQNRNLESQNVSDPKDGNAFGQISDDENF